MSVITFVITHTNSVDIYIRDYLNGGFFRSINNETIKTPLCANNLRGKFNIDGMKSVVSYNKLFMKYIESFLMNQLSLKYNVLLYIPESAIVDRCARYSSASFLTEDKVTMIVVL